MISGRTLGLMGATAVSCLVGMGIVTLIAFDLLGEELVIRAWRWMTPSMARPAATSSILENAKDITFFAKVPAKEHGLVIITGVAFETVQDFEAAKQRSRWCYVMVDPPGALSRRIDLATQRGMESPLYRDLSHIPSEELASAGLTVRTLQALSKSHCRFAKTSARPTGTRDGGRA